MSDKSAYTKSLLVLLFWSLLLTACVSPIDLTETPIPQTAVSTQTATSQPSRTPTLMSTVRETAVFPSTPQPTATHAIPTSTLPPSPTPIPTPPPSISWPILSSQGQLAFIKNRTLFVETAVGSGVFNEFGNNIETALWSPQGDQLIFGSCIYRLGQFPCDEITWNLFDLNTNSLSRLNDLISDLPSNYFGYPLWMRNGRRLLFENPLEGNIWLLDLDKQSFSMLIWPINTIYVWELPNENLLVQDHLGTNANALEVFALNGERLWGYPNPHTGAFEGANAGVLGFSEESQRLIIFEPKENLESNENWEDFDFATFYRFDPITFEIQRLFSTIGYGINISPDGEFFAMGVPSDAYNGDLKVIDLNGRSLGQRPNSTIIDWRPGGGPVVEEQMIDGQSQLVYWPLDGAAMRVFVSPKPFRFEDGVWSGSGKIFIYSAIYEVEKSYVYLWRPDNGAPILIHSADTGVEFRIFSNFTWLPDETAVYFNLGREELWKYDVETAVLILIADSQEE